MWIKSKLQILCEGNNIVGMKTAGTQHDHTMIPNLLNCMQSSCLFQQYWANVNGLS